MILGKRYNDVVARRLWRRRVWSWVFKVVGFCVVLTAVGIGVSRSRHQEPAVVLPEVQRTPRGIWCKHDECEYWDESGARWGHTAPSIGPLLLLVRDEQAEERDAQRMLSGILTAVDGIVPLGLRVRAVTLPDAEPGGLRLTLMAPAGYELLMDALGDVADQLSTLEVFLADKAKDQAFKPLYIDLRTPGRVYYK